MPLVAPAESKSCRKANPRYAPIACTTLKGIIIDLDGVIENEQGLEEGAIELVQQLVRARVPWVILTNDIRSVCYERVKQLNSWGFAVQRQQFLTPYDALTKALAAKGLMRPLILGGELPAEFKGSWESVNPDCVVLGDVSAVAEKLEHFTSLVRDGLPILALQRNAFLRSDGESVRDVGHYVAEWERRASITAEVIGKPGPYAYRVAIDVLRCDVQEVFMLSDSITNDLLGARNQGIRGLFMTKYASAKECLQAVEFAFETVTDLSEVSKRLRLEP